LATPPRPPTAGKIPGRMDRPATRPERIIFGQAVWASRAAAPVRRNLARPD
jgi:hypothetical protein